jgi:glycosyltransferase involved in cell wall biosynthesis
LSPRDREQYAADIVFVGHWEPRTEERIHYLRQAGFSVRVWGPGWKSARTLTDAGEIRPVYEQGYVKALAAAKICLCLLSHWNKNQATLRTFEIPAVGCFMLAESTAEQKTYFREEEEACFFSSDAELVELVRYYLSHDEERQHIAANGHRRCVSSPYSARERVAAVLSHFCDLRSAEQRKWVSER